MIETKDNVVVKMATPGVKPEDIDISVVGDTLTIKGETKSEGQFEEGSYIRKERRFGAFQRMLSLPASVAPDKAKAEFENGVGFPDRRLLFRPAAVTATDFTPFR